MQSLTPHSIFRRGAPAQRFAKTLVRALDWPLTYYTASRSGRSMARMSMGKDGSGSVIVVQDGKEVVTVHWRAESAEEPIPDVG